MEGFLKFLLGIAHHQEHSRDRLRPVYCLDQSLPLPETLHGEWTGYRGNKPVRSHNQAADHVQNDVYGEMILTLAPIFFDERFQHLRTAEHEALMLHLARHCERSINQPDAGLWELRNGWQTHSFTNLMCWAGLDRVERIQRLGFIREEALDFQAAKKAAEGAIHSAVANGVLGNGPHDKTLEAALALLPILRYPNSSLNRETVLAIARELTLPASSEGAFLYRYKRKDDFGSPASAFLICSFWLIQALAKIGELDQARALMAEAVRAANPLGLLSEHYSPSERLQLGNFPQGYSHVGLINAAFALSPAWDEVL
jgi:GH15 family glucan-1,4-alpha-glucosidase